MDFLKLANTRQSTRKYLSKPVEREKIERCVEAARLAPSACNSQPWKFIVVDNPELKEKIAAETHGSLISLNKFTHQAPVMVALVVEKMNITSSFGAKVTDREYCLIDVGIAAEHFCLQAAEEGLGTCILGWFDEKKIKQMLSVPDNRRIGLLMTLGYPDETPRAKNRKKLGQIISYNKYE